MEFSYLKDVVTLRLNSEKCTGCEMCIQVCVHGVLEMNNGTVRIVEKDACMECGACATNCPADAVTVNSGVGCAWAVFTDWFRRGPTAGSGQQAACRGTVSDR